MIVLVNDRILEVSKESYCKAKIVHDVIFEDVKHDHELVPGITYDMSFEDCMKESQGKMKYQELKVLHDKIVKQEQSYKLFIDVVTGL
jgi:hypothetical protein